MKKTGLIAGTLAVAAAGCFLLLHHGTAETPGADAAVPTVAVAPVSRQDLYNEVMISGEFRPYNEVDLHAKISGFLEKINVDFGDKVTNGQLLATLEVPELKDELDSAKAAVERAEADYANAHQVYDRMAGVNGQYSNLVAQQDIDTAGAKDGATAAALAEAKADLEKYQTLSDYTHIKAPFDGVITRRYADPGALIQAGTASDTQAKPLVRVSDNYRLRLDFPVSVAYVNDVHVGDKVEVRVDSMKPFTGEITRFTGKVNEDTRTMMTEIEALNPNLELVPGMYATVVLRTEYHPQVLAIPMAAISRGVTNTVFVVDSNSQIEERAVTLGMETPASAEILSGLGEGDLVIIGNRSLFHPGQKVQPKRMDAMAPL